MKRKTPPSRPPGLSRRGFLLGSAAAAGGLFAAGAMAPLTRFARAAEVGIAKDRYLVFAYFSGGWDVLLSLDPRDPAKYHADNIPNTLTYPGYELLDPAPASPLIHTPSGLSFGPYIGDLAAHADKLALIRGMSMDTLTHEAGRRRFLTGKVPSGLQARGSSAATWLASAMGESDPIPNLAMRVESFNAGLPSYASALSVNSVADLVRVLAPAPPELLDVERRQIDELLARTAQCESAERSPLWQVGENSRVRAHQMVEANLDQLFDFMAQTEEMAALRDHYGIVSASDAATSPGAQAALAARALKGGVSRVVSIQVTSGLDTHYDEWATDQGPNQQQGFDALSRLIEDLESSQYKDTGDTWLDHTTIVGFSEFSRTAMLNDRGGRDHSLTNSAFVLGAGIQGGQAIGRSGHVAMTPTTTNLQSGLSDPGGDIIRPEHVLQALMSDVGLADDPADLRVEPLRALLKSS